jgi:hypothetical protein
MWNMHEHGKFLGSWKDASFLCAVAFAVAPRFMSAEGAETVA